MDDVEIPDSSQAIEFTEQGVLKSPVGLTNLTTSISGAADLSIDLSYNGTSQYGSDFSVSKNNSSGYASGERTGQAIG
ncbi:flagellar hook protein FlgE [Citrobacter koseri]|uniref:Flagellar hook protein FlgE n=1 Tax=Citrobacter koseri TaxID=545 RepID=A0A2X2V5L7_CITKO|nr:flagellar hook protein FlgE [Citrobacter koseri]